MKAKYLFLFFMSWFLTAAAFAGSTKRVAPAAHDVTKGYSSHKKSSQKNKILAHSNTKNTNEADSQLNSVLKKCAGYCERLKQEALYYFCIETIYESYYPYLENPTTFDIKKLYKYVYDYQIIKTGDKIEERRTLINDNGKKVHIENAPVKSKSFYSYRSFFGPVGFVGEEWQDNYEYKIVKKTKKKGEEFVILDATPKKTIKNKPNYGRLWVREKDGAVLKIEIDQESLAGYGGIKKRARQHRAKPQIKVIHEYKEDHNGLLYPSQTEFIESYKGGPFLYKTRYKGKYTRTRTVFKFTDYKFFTVKTKTIERSATAADDVTKRYPSQKKLPNKTRFSSNSSIEEK